MQQQMDDIDNENEQLYKQYEDNQRIIKKAQQSKRSSQYRQRLDKMQQQMDDDDKEFEQLYKQHEIINKKIQKPNKNNILGKWRSKMEKEQQKAQWSTRKLYKKQQTVYEVDIEKPDELYQTKFQIISLLTKYYRLVDKTCSVKVQLKYEVQYKKQLESGDFEYPQPINFSGKMIRIDNMEQIQDVVQDIWQQYIHDVFNNEKLKGSGYILHKVNRLTLHVLPYQEKNVGSYIQLKDRLPCILNIQNKDNYCFIYCYMLSLYLQEHGTINNAYKPSNYKFEIKDNILHMKSVLKMNIDKKVDISSVEFPFQIKHINKLERLFDCSLSIYQIDEKNNNTRNPIQINTNPQKHHLDIAIVQQNTDNNSHCVLIKNINAFKAIKKNESKTTSYACNLCMFVTQNKACYDKHIDLCKKIINGGADVYDQQMPPKGNNILKFTNFQNMNRNPYKVYADFECVLQDIEQVDSVDQKTQHVKQHVPISFCLYFKSYNKQDSQQVVYKGYDCVDAFFNKLKDIEKFINKDIKERCNKLMEITQEEQQQFDEATHCYLCQQEFNNKDKKVRDHDHFTGKYRGPAHNVCNLQYNIQTNRYKVPVIFHNLKNYDAHFLIDGIYNHVNIKSDFSVLAQNNEKFISFQWNKFRFIDSFAFMPSSIAKLANNLINEQKVLTREHFNDLSEEDFNKFNQKGVFPYTWFNDKECFKQEQLPSQDDFYDDLNKNECSNDDYQQAQWVWQRFNCKTFEDYHDLYLVMDVLLLADIFEQFIDTCMVNYRLDPSFYYTSPGLSWDAMLLSTGTKFELLTDLSMHMMIEQGMRGGISTANHRYATSNNKYQQDYDKNKESSYIQYHDANNLYGWAMSQKLPLNDFKWIKVQDLQKHIDMITNYDENSEYGYFIDCDIHYPKELHDMHNNLPMAPENIITDEKTKINKLTPNLRDKVNYVAHIRNLQYYLQNGLIITKIHRIIKFHQEAYLKPYIEKNTALRTKATNAFEKDFFKLMNNSVFGKTMENVRGRANIKAIINKKQYNKAMQSIQLKSIQHVNDNLSLANFCKLKVVLNKPIYCGASILDLSKLVMYRYIYQHIYKQYGYKNVNLVYTDTDSFILNIKTDDFYKDMIKNRKQYDLSEYSETHPVYQLVKQNYPNSYQQILNENKKVVGLMKDECGSSQIKEVVAIRAKMYAYKLESQYVGKRLKGLKTNVTNKDISFDNYKDCLLNDKEFTHNQQTFKSTKHKITTISQNKVSLNNKNDKRHQINNIESYALGHYKIN